MPDDSDATPAREAVLAAVRDGVSASLTEAEAQAVEWAATGTLTRWALFRSGTDDYGSPLGDWFDPSTLRSPLRRAR